MGLHLVCIFANLVSCSFKIKAFRSRVLVYKGLQWGSCVVAIAGLDSSHHFAICSCSLQPETCTSINTSCFLMAVYLIW